MDQSRLQKLPAELRLHIYSFVLRQNTDIQLTYIEPLRKLIRTRPHGPLQGYSLLATCHQIRKEALPIFTLVNRLRLITSILGQYIKLVQGQPICASNIAAPLSVLQLWLSWSEGHNTTVDIDLGSWYTWWERATPEVVEPSITRFARFVRGTGANVRVLLRVEWCSIPMTNSHFDTILPLDDINNMTRVIDERLEAKQNWVDREPNRYYFVDHLEICRIKFARLLSLLQQ